MAGRKTGSNKKSTKRVAGRKVRKRSPRSKNIRTSSAGTPFQFFGYRETVRLNLYATHGLKEAREKSGLSIRQLAMDAGMSSGYLSKLEHGQRSISSEKAQEIEAILQRVQARQKAFSQAGK